MKPLYQINPKVQAEFKGWMHAMKWTEDRPQVSGFYWFKEKHPTEGGYFMPGIVLVRIQHNEMPDDSSWTDEEVLFAGCDVPRELPHCNGLWAGPIPPPSN